MSDEHCRDCCCARSWAALGITEYTGKSIPEHISDHLAALATLNERLERTALFIKRAIEFTTVGSKAEQILEVALSIAGPALQPAAPTDSSQDDAATESRPCTCPFDDKPATCQHKYALRDCLISESQGGEQ